MEWVRRKRRFEKEFLSLRRWEKNRCRAKSNSVKHNEDTSLRSFSSWVDEVKSFSPSSSSSSLFITLVHLLVQVNRRTNEREREIERMLLCCSWSASWWFVLFRVDQWREVSQSRCSSSSDVGWTVWNVSVHCSSSSVSLSFSPFLSHRSDRRTSRRTLWQSRGESSSNVDSSLSQILPRLSMVSQGRSRHLSHRRESPPISPGHHQVSLSLSSLLREKQLNVFRSAVRSLMYGYRFGENGHLSGGASYVLSREGIRFFEEYLTDPWTYSRCNSSMEDLMVKTCLELIFQLSPERRTRHFNLIGETIDAEGRERFHPLAFRLHFNGPANKSKREWIHSRPFHPTLFVRSSLSLFVSPLLSFFFQGWDSFSATTISFHYTKPEEMYQLDSFLYQIRAFDREVCLPTWLKQERERERVKGSSRLSEASQERRTKSFFVSCVDESLERKTKNSICRRKRKRTKWGLSASFSLVEFLLITLDVKRTNERSNEEVTRDSSSQTNSECVTRDQVSHTTKNKLSLSLSLYPMTGRERERENEMPPHGSTSINIDQINLQRERERKGMELLLLFYFFAWDVIFSSQTNLRPQSAINVEVLLFSLSPSPTDETFLSPFRDPAVLLVRDHTINKANTTEGSNLLSTSTEMNRLLGSTRFVHLLSPLSPPKFLFCLKWCRGISSARRTEVRWQRPVTSSKYSHSREWSERSAKCFCPSQSTSSTILVEWSSLRRRDLSRFLSFSLHQWTVSGINHSGITPWTSFQSQCFLSSSHSMAQTGTDSTRRLEREQTTTVDSLSTTLTQRCHSRSSRLDNDTEQDDKGVTEEQQSFLISLQITRDAEERTKSLWVRLTDLRLFFDWVALLRPIEEHFFRIRVRSTEKFEIRWAELGNSIQLKKRNLLNLTERIPFRKRALSNRTSLGVW